MTYRLRVLILSLSFCLGFPSEARCLAYIKQLLNPPKAIDIFLGAGLSQTDAESAIAFYESKLKGWNHFPLSLLKGRQMAAKAKDYAQMRLAEIPHEEALDASLVSYSNDYLALRKEGISHTDALEASEFEPDPYLRLIKASIKHKDAVDVLNNHEDKDIRNYIALRKEAISHEDALDVIETVDSIDNYLKIRNAGARHDEAHDFISNIDDSEVDGYVELRSKLNHEDAMEVVENYVVRDYLDIRDIGDSHQEAMNALELDLITDYITLRTKKGITHLHALEVAENYSVTDYLSLRENDKVTHEDAIDVIDSYDITQYLRLRTNNFSHNDAIDFLNR